MKQTVRNRDADGDGNGNDQNFCKFADGSEEITDQNIAHDVGDGDAGDLQHDRADDDHIRMNWNVQQFQNQRDQYQKHTGGNSL